MTDAAWTTSPDATTKIRGPELLGSEPVGCESYFAQWGWKTHEGRVTWVDFRIWQVCAIADGGAPIFQDDDSDLFGSSPMGSDPTAYKPFAEGFRKWDGCTQWTWSDHVHIDRSETLVEMFDAVRATLIVCADILGETWDGGAK